MSRTQSLRALVAERLTAAAEEVLALVERTMAEYEEELSRSKEENQRTLQLPQQHLLIHGCQINLQTQDPELCLKLEIPEPPQIKVEPEEQRVKQEEEQFTESSPQTDIIITEVSSLCDEKHSHTAEPFSCPETQHGFNEGHLENDPTSGPQSTAASPQMETDADTEDTGPAVHSSAPGPAPAPEASASNSDEPEPAGGGETKHECPFCAKILTTEQNLEMHLRVHTEEKPYSCLICKRMFTREDHLELHVQTHAAERPSSVSDVTSGGSSSVEGSTAFNVQYRGEKTHISLHGLSYSSFLSEARRRLGIGSDAAVSLQDDSGTEVDDDVFAELIEQKPGVSLVVVDAPSAPESAAPVRSRLSRLCKAAVGFTAPKRPRLDHGAEEPKQFLNITTSADTDMSQNCPSAFKESLNTTTSADTETSQNHPSTFKEMSNSTSEDSFSKGCEDSVNTDHEDSGCVPESDGGSDGSRHSEEFDAMETSTGSRDSSCSDGTPQSSSNSSSNPCTVTSSTVTPITVTSAPTKGTKYSKKQYCLFCEKPITKLARHLEHVHKNEQDVALALSFDKGSKKRKEILHFLKKRGNFSHNAKVAMTGVGELVACRRPEESQPPDAFVHCRFCQGLYLRKFIWKHMQRIHKESVQKDSDLWRKGLYMHLPKPASVKDAVWTVVCGMINDDISAVVRSEDIILQFGESLYNSKMPPEKRRMTIRQKMRELARLLITARTITPLKSMEDLVTSANFLHIIKAVKSASGYKEGCDSSAVPALALRLGRSLIKVAGIIHCNALIKDRKDIAEAAKKFGILYMKKWNQSVSSAALDTDEPAKWNKPLVFPFIQDVTRLHKFLSVERAKCMKALEEEPNERSFAKLVKVTLTQILLFNKRREGEVSKMGLQSYTSRDLTKSNLDTLMSLGKFERQLSKHFERVAVSRNRFEKVPVLLTPEMTTALALLSKKREQCRVPKNNIYVFAQPESRCHYRGTDCLREYAKLCGAQHPEALTSVRLHEQVATLSIVLNLKDDKLVQLATFLGHDVRDHPQYYHLSETPLQLAKVCKLLMAMEKGKQPELQGKQLDDIIINPEDEVETCDSGEEDASNEHKGDSHENPTVGTPQRRVPKEAVKVTRRRWTAEEVRAVEQHMWDFIAGSQVPGKRSCSACLQAEPRALKARDWLDIKNYVYNRINALKKKRAT